ncbi:MAG: histone deacetylase family protein [Nitrosomonadales bacterium]|nr:histone deacetylase family protein [Nitrosomonadales bacterium]
MHTAYITHPACLKHDMGAGHPECPARIQAIEDHLVASGLLQFLDRVEARQASVEELALAHGRGYIEAIFRRAPASGLVYLDPDTAMNPHSLEAALRAAGAAVMAVDRVMSGEAENAFCNIRPPGHHAGRNSAAGFCIFNNVAAAAAHALERHGLERVAIADFDVHHGNGTEDIFHDDARVMLCSTFRHPYYPYCGADSGNEHIINVPLPYGTSGEEFRDAVTRRWLPALERFRPQLLLVSAGFDAHREDEMGGFGLNENDYAWVTGAIKDIAGRHAGGRIVSVLEGGYALQALGRSALAHIRVLGGM